MTCNLAPAARGGHLPGQPGLHPAGPGVRADAELQEAIEPPLVDPRSQGLQLTGWFSCAWNGIARLGSCLCIGLCECNLEGVAVAEVLGCWISICDGYGQYGVQRISFHLGAG